MKFTNIYMLNLLLVLSITITAQEPIYFNQIGEFKSAISISINPAGFIFVSDQSTNEITKLDTLGNIIKTIGGYGWSSTSFDFPIDIFATTLNVYVADKNNDRIQIFDKDLNFLSEFSSKNISNSNYAFRYPTCVSVYSQGDFFILDSDNTRILKFNFKGEFSTSIGGFESSSYVLREPKSFVVIVDGKILVIDSNTLVTFDQFGNFISKRNLDFSPQNINSNFRSITLTGPERIDFSVISDSQSSLQFKTCTPNINHKIVDSSIFNNKLYVLTETNIIIYQLISY